MIQQATEHLPLSARIIHGYLLRQLILSRGAHCSSNCNGPSAFLLDVPITRCIWGSNGCPVRVRRSLLREAHDPLHLGEQQVPRFGLNSLATASMNNPGWRAEKQEARDAVRRTRPLCWGTDLKSVPVVKSGHGAPCACSNLRTAQTHSNSPSSCRVNARIVDSQ